MAGEPANNGGQVQVTVRDGHLPDSDSGVLDAWPHDDPESLDTFYGNPRGGFGNESEHWAASNLVHWAPPYPMYYSDGHHTPMQHLLVHRKCLSTFNDAFKDALALLGHNYIAQHHLNVTGGTFCYRTERGGSRLSVHSWGCAIDIDPQHNPFPHHWEAGRGMMDLQFAKILQKRGFDWRGASGDIDPMHFQLCRHRRL